MISEKVKLFIEKYELKEPFIVGFSGGYDSMCLADILSKLKYSIILVHLNHNWRGEESLKEEENCKNFAKERNISFYSETLPDNVKHCETVAREERYKFFEKCAKKFDSNVIFTAHNFDDNAETVLYRITKGTGLIGLQGIAEKRDNLYYRPLLTTTREEIENYCICNNLTPNKDSSNEDIKYKRNLIRKKIIPLMEKINPKVKKVLNTLSQIANEDAHILKANDKYQIRSLLIENGIDYDKKKIEEIKIFIDENKSSKSGKKMSLGTDKWLFVSDKELKIVGKNKKNDTCIKITTEGEYKFEDKIFSLKKYSNKVNKYPDDSEYKAFVVLKDLTLDLRHRKDGDIIWPLGCSGIQKLKKYLNEKKVPNYIKDDLIFLCSNNEVLWAAGYGISEKIKVDEKPTHVIELRKEDE